MLGEDRATVESEHARLAATGARVSVLDAAGVEQRFPALSTCSAALDLDAEEHRCNSHDRFLFEEDGGYCTDPAGANQDLLDAARRNGVDVRLGCAVAGIRTVSGRVQQVDLADGSSLSAGVAINAAGPWCNAINAMAGLELSWTLRPTRVQVLFRVSVGEHPGDLPLVADAAGGIYFRPESQAQQILVGSIRPEDELEEVGDPDDFDRSLDSDMRERLLAALHHRVPSLPHRGRVTGVAGLYTMTEQDVHPIVGPTAIDGFLVANGFSGHGFKLAPAIGSMLAQWITGRRTELDTDVPIEFLSVERESLQVREKSVLA
jgi:glycine/D-amino acid oxidase-like deaminating enzyme